MSSTTHINPAQTPSAPSTKSISLMTQEEIEAGLRTAYNHIKKTAKSDGATMDVFIAKLADYADRLNVAP